jgi:hypothetical protein
MSSIYVLPLGQETKFQTYTDQHTYHHAKFLNSVLNRICVTLTTQVRTATRVILLIKGNYKYQEGKVSNDQI